MQMATDRCEDQTFEGKVRPIVPRVLATMRLFVKVVNGHDFT